MEKIQCNVNYVNVDNLFYNGHYKTKLSYTDYCCVTEDFATENLDEEALHASENFGFPRQFPVKCLNRGDINHATACCFLLTQRSLKCLRQNVRHAVHGCTQFVIQNLIQTCELLLFPVYFDICFLLRRRRLVTQRLYYTSAIFYFLSVWICHDLSFRGFFVLEVSANLLERLPLETLFFCLL